MTKETREEENEETIEGEERGKVVSQGKHKRNRNTVELTLDILSHKIVLQKDTLFSAIISFSFSVIVILLLLLILLILYIYIYYYIYYINNYYYYSMYMYT